MKYLRYFLYITWHWGIDLAIFIVRHEIRGEKKYGINTIGLDNLSDTVTKEERLHVSTYEPVNYYTAGWLLDHISVTDTTFMDMGCGRGRVLAMAAAYGFKNIIGIDFSQKLCNEAATVCANLPVTITCADARTYTIPDSVGVIFLFNPFDASVMSEFILRVQESLARKNRPLTVLYANPQCKDLWLEAGFTETASFVKKRYLKGSILKN